MKKDTQTDKKDFIDLAIKTLRSEDEQQNWYSAVFIE